jgi:hypothetical protein
MDFFFPNLALGQVGEGKACILSDFDNQFFFLSKIPSSLDEVFYFKQL